MYSLFFALRQRQLVNNQDRRPLPAGAPSCGWGIDCSHGNDNGERLGKKERSSAGEERKEHMLTGGRSSVQHSRKDRGNLESNKFANHGRTHCRNFETKPNQTDNYAPSRHVGRYPPTGCTPKTSTTTTNHATHTRDTTVREPPPPAHDENGHTLKWSPRI